LLLLLLLVSSQDLGFNYPIAVSTLGVLSSTTTAILLVASGVSLPLLPRNVAKGTLMPARMPASILCMHAMGPLLQVVECKQTLNRGFYLRKASVDRVHGFATAHPSPAVLRCRSWGCALADNCFR